MIHGVDVARAILAVHQNFAAAAGQRWLLTDMRVYDWWDLASAWGNGGAEGATHSSSSSTVVVSPDGPQPLWVKELMKEQGVRVLPRSPADMGRVLDSREFWDVFGLSPLKARLE